MDITTVDQFHKEVAATVHASHDICVAIDEQLNYIAFNDKACKYLRIKATDMIGRSALQVYPDIVASRNHRNILRAISGITIPLDLVESRMGDILKASYTPVFVEKEVKAVILNAVVYLAMGQ
jgi:PAS domain-containing protein